MKLNGNLAVLLSVVVSCIELWKCIESLSISFTKPLYNVGIYQDQDVRKYVAHYDFQMGIEKPQEGGKIIYKIRDSSEIFNTFEAESKLVGDFFYLRIRTKYTASLNRERIGFYNLTVQGLFESKSTGKLETSCKTQVVIKVLDRNDNCPMFLNEKFEFIAHENASIATQIGVVTATDADEGINSEIFYYLDQSTITTDSNKFPFSINPFSGIIYPVQKLFDFVGGSKLSAKVYAIHRGDLSLIKCDVISQSVISISVVAHNVHAPKISIKYLSKYFDPNLNDYPFAEITVTDDDDRSNRNRNPYPILIKHHSESLVNVFLAPTGELNRYVLKLRAIFSPFTAESISITIEAKDLSLNPKTSSTHLTIPLGNLRDINLLSVPEFVSVSIPENAIVNSSICLLKTVINSSNANNLLKLNFALIPDFDGTYSVNDISIFSSGVVSVAKELNAEDFGSRERNLTIAVAMKDSLATKKTFTLKISVQDINEFPPVVMNNGSVIRVKENTEIGETVLLIHAYDPDISRTKISYYLFDQDNLPFRLSEFKRNVVILKENLDAETMQRRFPIRVLVTDSGAPIPRSVIAHYEIEIEDENEYKPEFVYKSCNITISRDAPYHLKIGQFIAEDLDRDWRDKIRISIDSVSFQEPCFAINSESGTLSLMCTFKQRNLNKLTNFTIRLQANDSGLLSSKMTLNVSVVDANFRSLSGKPIKLDCVKNDIYIRMQENYRILHQRSGSSKINHPINNEESNKPVFGMRSIPMFATNIPSVIHIREELATGTIVQRITMKTADKDRDPYESEFVFGIWSDEEQLVFSIVRTSSHSADIVVADRLDRETVDKYHMTIAVCDQGKPKNCIFKRIEIQVEDINDNPPRFIDSFQIPMILPENYDIRKRIVQIKATDADSKDIQYRLVNFRRVFKIHSRNGWLRLRVNLDREKRDYYPIVIVAFDFDIYNRSLTATATLTIIVTDINDNKPIFTKNSYSLALPEDLPIGSFLVQLHATDADLDDNSLLRYAIHGIHSECFHCDTSTGAVHLLCKLSPMTEYRLIAVVKDNGKPQTLSSQADFQIYPQKVQPNRYIPSLKEPIITATIRENCLPGTRVTSIRPETSEREPQSFVYTISGQSNGISLFQINNEGEIRTVSSIDRERDEFYWLYIYIEDRNDDIINKILAEVYIKVTDENDNCPMPERAFYKISVVENLQGIHHLITVKATDADMNRKTELKYKIISGDTWGYFSISSTGEISTSERSIDREPLKSTCAFTDFYDMKVMISDSGVPEQINTVNVHANIIDINDNAPSFINDNVFVFNRYLSTELINYHRLKNTNILIGRVTAVDIDYDLNATVRYTMLPPKAAIVNSSILELFSVDVKSGHLFANISSSIFNISQNFTVAIPTFKINIWAYDLGAPTMWSSSPAEVTIRLYLSQNATDPKSENDKSKLYLAYLPSDSINIVYDECVGSELMSIPVVDQLDPNGISLEVQIDDAEGPFSVIWAKRLASTSYKTEALLVVADSLINQGEKLTLTITIRNTKFYVQHKVTIFIKFYNKNFPTFNLPTSDPLLINIEDHTKSPKSIYKVKAVVAPTEFPNIFNSSTSLSTISNTELFEPIIYSISASNDPITVQKLFHINSNNGDLRLISPANAYRNQTFDIIIEARNKRAIYMKLQIHILDTNNMNPEFLVSREQSNMYMETLRNLARSQSSVLNEIDKLSIQRHIDNSLIFSFTWIDVGSSVGTLLTSISATDQDCGRNGQLVFAIKNDSIAMNYFEMDQNNGDIRVQHSLTAIRNRLLFLTIVVSDLGQPARINHSVVAVEIRDKRVSHSLPQLEESQLDLVVLENTSVNTILHCLKLRSSTKPLTTAQYVVLSIKPSTGKLFGVTRSTGCIITVSSLDREQFQDIVSMNIQVQSYDGLVSKYNSIVSVKIHIADVNDNPPRFLGSLKLNGVISESANPGSLLFLKSDGEKSSKSLKALVINAEDPDEGKNGQIEYVILSPVASYFKIDQHTGVLSLASEIDREVVGNSVDLSIRLQDRGSPPLLSQEKLEIIITIEDENDSPPKFEKDFYLQVLILPTFPSAPLLQLRVHDPDLNPTILFSILNGKESKFFSIDSITGWLKISPNDVPVSGKFPSVVLINIRAFDGKFETSCNITINSFDNSRNQVLPLEKSQVLWEIPENRNDVPDFVLPRAKFYFSHQHPSIKYILLSEQPGVEINEITGSLKLKSALDREARPSFKLLVLAKGWDGSYDYINVIVNVTDENDYKPTFLSERYEFLVHTNLSKGAQSIKVKAIDFDAGENGSVIYSIYYVKPFAYDLKFVIDSNTGVITIQSGPRKHLLGKKFTIGVKANDKGQPALSSFTDVFVDIVSDKSPLFDQTKYSVTVLEGAIKDSIVSTVRAISSTGHTILYTITKGNDEELFDLDFTTAYLQPGPCVIRLVGQLDYETKPLHTLIISATDPSSSLSHSTTVLITVLDINDELPIFLKSSYSASVSENMPINHEIISISVIPQKGFNNKMVEFSLKPIEDLSPCSSQHFKINQTTGIISIKKNLDFESCVIHEFWIQVKYDGSFFQINRAHMQVNIVDENDNPPRFMQPAFNATISLESSQGSLVVIAMATDLDNNSKLIYKILNEHYNIFKIDQSSGFIRFNQVPNIEKLLPSSGVVEFQVLVHDFTHSVVANVSVNIVSTRNHPPSFVLTEFHMSVSENFTVNSEIGRIVASDSDENEFGKLRYRVIGGDDSANFELDSLTGAILLKKPLDRERKRMHELRVAVSDYGNKHDFATVLIHVTDINDNIPVIEQAYYEVTVILGTKSTRTTLESILQLHAKDRDISPRHRMDYRLVSPTLSQSIAIVDSITGTVSLKPVWINQNINLSLNNTKYKLEEHQIAVQVCEEPLYSYRIATTVISCSTNVTVKINILYDNKKANPIITCSIMTIQENNPLNHIVAMCRISSTEMKGKWSLVPSSSPLDVQNDFEINSNYGYIRAKKIMDFETQSQYRINVEYKVDNSPLMATRTILIDLIDQNDCPPIFDNSRYTISISEDIPLGSKVIQCKAYDKDYEGKDVIFYSLYPFNSAETSVSFRIDDQGWVYLISAVDYEETKLINFIVSASDKAGHVTNTTLTISVFDVNDEIPYWTKDPPVDEIEITETCDGCSATFPRVVYRLSAKDNDTESQKESLRFLITNQNLNPFYAYFQVSEIGEVLLLHPLDAEKILKPLQLKLLASDRLHWSKEEFVLNVRVIDINDHAPVCPQIPDLMIFEGITPGSVVTTLQAYDRDSSAKYNTITYKLTECSDPYLLVVEPLTGRVIVNAPLDREYSSTVTFVVDAFDVENKKCSFKILINVLDINDNAPRFVHTTIAPFLENAPHGSVIGKIHAVDADSGINRKIVYRILDDSKSSFSIDRDTGIMRVASLLDRERQPEHHLVVEAADCGKPSKANKTNVKIVLLDVNDSPPQFLNTPLKLHVTESAEIGKVLITIKAVSDDIGVNAEVSYQIITEQNQFHLGSVSGNLTLIKKLDFELIREYFLTVRASDKGYPSLSTTTVVTIQVIDVNDNVPQFPVSLYVFNIPENTLVSKFTIGKVSAFDSDSGINGMLTYSFLYWLPEQKWHNRSTLNHIEHFFRINPNSGEISLNFVPDREEQSTYKFQVSVTDHGIPALSSKTNVTIEIEDKNDNPPEFSQPSFRFLIQVDRSGIIPDQELKKNGDMFEVGRLHVKDKDGPANSKPFQCKLLNAETVSPFSVKTDELTDECVLLVAGSLYLGVRTLWVQVTDNGQPSLYCRVQVTVNVIRLSNIPPEIEPLNVTYVYYHSEDIIGKELEIARVLVRDRSPAFDMLTFEFIYNETLKSRVNNNFFKIDSFTGAITTREMLDSGMYSLNVKVTNVSLSAEKVIFIKIVALTKDMIRSACVIQVSSMKPNIFFARRLDLKLINFLKTTMASKLAYIISVKSSSRRRSNRIKRSYSQISIDHLSNRRIRRQLAPDDIVDVLIAVYNENEHRFFKSSALVDRIKTLISDLTKIFQASSVKIFNNVCDDRHICVEGQCQTTIMVNPKLPPINFQVHGVTFLSMDFSYESSCLCTKHFEGVRCEIPMNKCAHKPCGSVRICRPDPTKSPGFVCECPELKSGKYCEKSVIIEGNSSCLDEQCIFARVSEPIHFTGGGFIMWYLREKSNALRMEVIFSFRVLQKPAPLMEIQWNSIRSILIDINSDGKVLISADHKTVPLIDMYESVNAMADGKWHNIRLSILGVVNMPDWWLHVVIDGLKPRLLSLSSWVEGDHFNQTILIGARNYISTREYSLDNSVILDESMTGCIQDVILNNQKLPYQKLPVPVIGSSLSVVSKNLNYGCSESLMRSLCAAGVCKNGGLCLIRDYENDNKRSYVCQCQETFTGRNCEIPNSICRHSPCVHGGRCVDTKNGFKCICPDGLSGPRCQWGKSCSSLLNPCPTFATCLEKTINSLYSSAVCDCSHTLRGYMCQIDVDECQIQPPLCKPGRGICHNLHSGYQCNCSLGYRGQHCEIDGLISIYPDNSSFGLSQFHIYVIVGILACLFVLALLTVVVLVLRMKPIIRMNSGRKKDRNAALSLDPLYPYNVYTAEQCSRYSPASSMMASSMHHTLGYVGGITVEPPSTPGGRSQMSFHQVPPTHYGHMSQDAIDRVSLCSSNNEKREINAPPPMVFYPNNRYIRSSRGQLCLNPADPRQRLPHHSSTFSLVPCHVVPPQIIHYVPNRNSAMFYPGSNHPRMVYDQMLHRGSNLSLHSSKAASAQWEPSDNRLDESANDMVQSDCPSLNQFQNGNIVTLMNGEIDPSVLSWNGPFVEDGIYHREMISSQEMSLTDTTDRSTAHLLPKITPKLNFRAQPPVIHQMNIAKPIILINQNGHSESPKTVSPSSASIPSGTSSDTKGTAPECEPRELKKKSNKISPDSNSGEGTENDTEDLEMDHPSLHSTVFPTNKHLQEDAEDGLSSVPLLDSIN